MTSMQHQCADWLSELYALLDLGLDLSGDSSVGREIAMHKLRESQLALELKEARELYASLQREVKETKDEIEMMQVSAKA